MVINMKDKKHTNNTQQDQYSYDIDYDIFTTEEIIKIINFYQDVHKYVKHKISYDTLKESYNVYRNIINSIALEKKYNKAFFDKTKISIYHLMNK